MSTVQEQLLLNNFATEISIIKAAAELPEDTDVRTIDPLKSILPKFAISLGSDADMVALKVNNLTLQNNNLNRNNVLKIIEGFELGSLSGLAPATDSFNLTIIEKIKNFFNSLPAWSSLVTANQGQTNVTAALLLHLGESRK